MIRRMVRYMVVAGDSLIWGEGLPTEQKMSSLVRDTVGGPQTRVTMLAHCGAIIGQGLNPPIVPFPSDVAREVPQHNPTIFQQVRTFNDHPENVDLVLINGGANDLSFEKILNPITSTEELTHLTHLYCGEHFRNLLSETAARFPNARIIAVGQYPILSSRSDIDLLHLFLKGFFIQSIPDDSFEDAFAGLRLDEDAIKAKVVSHCILFWQESMKANQDAVKALNNPRIKCAFAPFTERNAALADDPWVFAVTGLLQPEDPMKDARQVACDASTINPFTRFICHRASVGHPNVKGEHVFATTIVDVYNSF